MTSNIYFILCRAFNIKDLRGAVFKVSTFLTVCFSFYFGGLVVFCASKLGELLEVEISANFIIWGTVAVCVAIYFVLLSLFSKAIKQKCEQSDTRNINGDSYSKLWLELFVFFSPIFFIVSIVFA